MDNNQVVSPLASPSKPAKFYIFRNPYPQCFAVPYAIIKSMIKNPRSPKVYLLLLETCKYFYSTNQMLPICNIYWYTYLGNLKCYADREFIEPSIASSKIWIYNSFRAIEITNVVPSMVPKIFKFDFHHLTIAFQKLTWNDYQKLISSGAIENLHLWKCVITNADATIVTLDKLIENLHQIKQFRMNFSSNTLIFKSDTVKKMIHHLHGFKKLRTFELLDLSESFDLISLNDFLMKNKTVDFSFNYSFSFPVSDAYKEAIENMVEEIKENPFLKVPVVQM